MNKLTASACLFAAAIAPLHAEGRWGNPFQVGVTEIPFTADPQTNQWASFTAWDPMVVTAAQIRLQSVTAPSLTVSLHEGNPSGTPGPEVASAVLKSPQDGWNRAVFQNVALEEGKVYQLVLQEPAEGAATWVGITCGPRGVQPSGLPDPNWSRGSGSQMDFRTTVMFFLETKNGTLFGQPYTSKLNCKLLGTIPAQRFVFHPPPTGENLLAGVSLSLNIAQTIDDEYTLALLDDKDEIVEAIKIPGKDVPTSKPKSYSFAFSGTTQLQDGKTYSLAFYSDSPSVDGAWVSVRTEASDKLAEEATWQGTKGFAFGYSDDSLKSPTEPELNRDMVFQLELQ